jgi:putative tricarboxylic transport membrane protein
MRISDLLFGLLFALLGVGVFIYALWLPSMPGQRYGAGAFPAVLGASFFAAGGLLSWRGYRQGDVASGIAGLAAWARDPALLANVLLTLGAIIGYVILDEYVGFALLGFAILMLFFLRFGVPAFKGAIIAALMIVFIQISFVSLLRVPLPRGILDRLLW